MGKILKLHSVEFTHSQLFTCIHKSHFYVRHFKKHHHGRTLNKLYKPHPLFWVHSPNGHIFLLFSDVHIYVLFKMCGKPEDIILMDFVIFVSGKDIQSIVFSQGTVKIQNGLINNTKQRLCQALDR